jgi:hypothetical protein
MLINAIPIALYGKNIINKRTMRIAFYLLLPLFILFSCKEKFPRDLKGVLDASGNNKSELQKVLDHYSKNKEEEKYKAACFLLGNMGDKFWYDGKIVRGYDEVFKIIDSLKDHNVHPLLRGGIIKSKFDSITKYYGLPFSSRGDTLLDYQHIRANYLIENIDLAFDAWKESKFKENVNFNTFCNYILPYRVGTEIPESWRNKLRSKYKLLRDSNDLANNDILKYAADINDDIENQISYNNSKRIWIYPFDMTTSNAERGYAICRQGVYYTVMAMRANGLPGGADYTPRWANNNSGHYWNIILKEDGNFFPFDAMTKPFKRLDIGDRKIAKVFRESFDINAIYNVPDHFDIPKKLKEVKGIDVTEEYVKTYDINIPIEKPYKQKKEYAIICTFDNRNWQPQWWGKIEGDNASFLKMASDVIYIVMFYDQKLIPATKPFLLTKDGKIKYISPNENLKSDMILYRKYPCTKINYGKMAKMKDGIFQGSNDSLFSNPTNLYTVDSVPLKFETAIVTSSQTFRYVRFLSPPGNFGQVAELEFYDENENKLQGKIMGNPKLPPKESYFRAFDGNMESYFIAENSPLSWVGLDLGKRMKIAKIKYCPRSDVNFIIAGNDYNLSYWNGEKWASLGNMKATEAVLKYKQVPTNAIYLLHCLTKGVEDRIFTYENDKQVWW